MFDGGWSGFHLTQRLPPFCDAIIGQQDDVIVKGEMMEVWAT